MKVCDLALFSPDTSSGVKTYIASKIEYARTRNDIEHVVIVPGPKAGVSVQGRTKVIIVPGVRSFYPGISIAINPWKVAAVLEAECADVIELNCQYTLPWAAFLATRQRRTPIVGVYHTDLPACVRHMTRGAGLLLSSAAERAVEWYEGLIYRHCTRTVILNPGMHERVRRLGVDRLCCLPCGVDTATFAPSRRDAEWRARVGVDQTSTVLLYVGRLSVEKEVDILLDAFDRLPPGAFSLCIVGDGPDADAIASHAHTHPGVTFLGHVESRDELAAVYASSDIFLSPGRHETFGMATLEAMSCGLPVVAIRESGTAAFVPPELGLLARSGDSGDFARAIVTVATWPLEQLRSACHAFAAKSYGWDLVLDQYFAVYRQVIAETAGTMARA